MPRRTSGGAYNGAAERAVTWRVAEAAAAAALGLLLVPIATLTALATAVTLGRPVLFRQARSGLGGRPFVLLKFRTMRPGDAGANDALRTPAIGRWLRRTRLDELPQLVNIVLGDMSFVGPRPLLPETIAAFGDQGRVRGTVRPGLTGWSQVNGNTKLTDAEKLALDLWYIEHRTPMRDLTLVFRTAAVLLFGERANALELERAHAGGRRRRG